jgi:hypothetical protein
VSEADPLGSALLRTSAQVAGLCDAIEHLELVEVAGILEQAEALARAAVTTWIERSPVARLVDDLVDRSAKRRVKHTPWDPSPPSGRTPQITTWEQLRGHLAWSDTQSDLDFMGRERPAQLRHLSYSFPKLAAKLADEGIGDPARLAPQCLLLAFRVITVCRAHFDDATIAQLPSVRR